MISSPAIAGRRSATRARDVARQAGVSLSTVSNALNRPELVAEETLRRVQDVMSDLGFVRNGVARSLSTGLSASVGLILNDLSTLSVEIARGVQGEAQRHGFVALMATSYGDIHRERQHLREFVGLRVAGIVIVAALGGEHDRSLGTTPTVVIADEPGASVEPIRLDLGSAAGVAAQHLVATGRTRLAFVGGPMRDPIVGRRLEAATHAISATAGARMEYVGVEGMSHADGRFAGATIRGRGAGVYDGIVAASDQLAMGILQDFHGVPGFRVPQDVAVIGTDGEALAEATTPPLTTVTYPGADLGRAAIQSLFAQLSNTEAGHRSPDLSPRVTVRESTGTYR